MQRYRKKPVVIEAQQWLGSLLGATVLIDWMGGAGRYEPAETVNSTVHPAHLVITTLEDGPNGKAKHVASPGDWVIKGVAGEFYACKPGIFQATYALADVDMSFGDALAALEQGERVARAGWNGKGMWVVLIHPGNALFTKGGSSLPMQTCFGLKTPMGEMQPGWVASQADMLARDWLVVGGSGDV